MTKHDSFIGEVVREFKLKFNEVLWRMYKLEIVPEIQSRIKERIPGGSAFMVFSSAELEAFIISSVKSDRERIHSAVLEALPKKRRKACILHKRSNYTLCQSCERYAIYNGLLDDVRKKINELFFGKEEK
jgi:hypothetical protein